MELNTAIHLIEKGVDKDLPNQLWADLGAGSGLFTRALVQLLKPPCSIYAVDINPNGLKNISSNYPAAEIIPVVADFTKDDLPVSNPDGIIMANSLHYVSDPLSFLQKLKSLLKPGGRIIIIEYDTDKPNTWVPWPVSYKKLQEICKQVEKLPVEKIATHPSMYRGSGMYVAVMKPEV